MNPPIAMTGLPPLASSSGAALRDPVTAAPHRVVVFSSDLTIADGVPVPPDPPSAKAPPVPLVWRSPLVPAVPSWAACSLWLAGGADVLARPGTGGTAMKRPSVPGATLAARRLSGFCSSCPL